MDFGFAAARALATVELLAFAPRTAPGLAAGLGSDPRTARRLLRRLVAEGWALRVAGRHARYVTGFRAVAVAAQALRRVLLPARGLEVVAALRRDTGACVELAVPCYGDVLQMEPLERGDVVMRLRPPHATAAGKVLLACRDGWRQQVLAAPLRSCTRRTLVTREAIEGDCAWVRRHGYAVDDGESEPGRYGVAVPAPWADGEVLLALGMKLPTVAPRARASTELAGRARRAAAALVNVLGDPTTPWTSTISGAASS